MDNATKEQVYLQTKLHTLNVCFEQDALQKLASFPPIYVRVGRGSQISDSEPVTLFESSQGSCTYTAVWDQMDILPLSLNMTRDKLTREYGTKHVKFLLKIFSEGKSSHKTLATYNLDVADLNLSTLDFVSSAKEDQRIEFSVGKNALSAISSISLDVTFYYSPMDHQFAHSPPDSNSLSYYSPVTSPSPMASPSPPPDLEHNQTDSSTCYYHALTVSHEHDRRDAELRRLEMLTGSGPYDKLLSVRVNSESPEGRLTEAAPPDEGRRYSVGEVLEADRRSFATESIGSLSVDLGESCPVTAEKKKRKGKRLKGFFKLKGPKSKAKSKGKGLDANLDESTRISVEMNGHPKTENGTEGAKTPLETSGTHSLEAHLEPEFKRVVLNPDRQPAEMLPPPTNEDNLVSTTEPEKQEPPREMEGSSGLPPASARHDPPLPTRTPDGSYGHRTPPEKVESIQVADSPPTVRPSLNATVSTGDRHLVHHAEPNQPEPPKSAVVPQTQLPGPPPKPKRRTRAVPTTGAVGEMTASVSMESLSTSSPPESKEIGLRHRIGTSLEDLTQIPQDPQVSNMKEGKNEPSTQPVQNSTPQTSVQNSTPQTSSTPQRSGEGLPAAVDAEVFRERSASIGQVLDKRASEPETPARLRSFSASPEHRARPPEGQDAMRNEERRISEGQANRRSPLARRHAFKAAQGPHLVSRKACQMVEEQLPSKGSPPPPGVNQSGDAPPSHGVSKIQSPRQLKGSSSSPNVSMEPRQPRVKRMSAPNGTTTATSSGPPHKLGTQQSKPTKVSKLLSGSTPMLTAPRKTPGKKYSSTADLFSSNAKSSLTGDLVVRPVRSSTVENLVEELSSSDQILHGLLRIQVMGVDLGDAPKGPKHSITDMILKPDMLRDLPDLQEEEPSEGLFCIFTINGSNSRAETTIQPIIPRRPVKWEEGGDFLFYTSQARQVFVMCRKKKLNDASSNNRVALGGRRTGATRDSCIGAAILSLSDLKTTPIPSTNSTNNMIEMFQKQQLEAVTLPLQPKGRILLRTSFNAFDPSLKVSCKGTIAIESLSGLDCNPEHDISCTVKIDSQFQDCTAVLNPEECASEGWQEDPIEFTAYNNMHCDIQVWAYSAEETEYWCGGCIAPLALALPVGDVRYHLGQADKRDKAFVVTGPCQRTVRLPIEPQGIVTLSLLLYPSPRSSPTPMPTEEEIVKSSSSPEPSGSSGPSQTISREVSFSPEHHSPPSTLSRTWRGKSLRRNFTIKKAGDLDLQVPKTYKEEPFMLQQENTDLKREVEFLREELRQAKSKLAESEFFREKTLMEVKLLQDEFQELKSQQKPVKGEKNKQKNRK